MSNFVPALTNNIHKPIFAAHTVLSRYGVHLLLQ